VSSCPKGTEATVKNGFSDLTKEGIGQDQCRKDIMNDHQEKVLKEGCCEREQAWMDVLVKRQ